MRRFWAWITRKPKPRKPDARLTDAIARFAESKIGVREEGGNNEGPGLQPFFDADWYDPEGPGDSGYAWCAAFVCWCVQQALRETGSPIGPPRTPRAWGLERWGKDQNLDVRTEPGRDIQRGDVVVFRISHVGIAVSGPDSEGRVLTVEGNTNAAGSREGDGVYRKSRHCSEFRSRIRLPGSR